MSEGKAALATEVCRHRDVRIPVGSETVGAMRYEPVDGDERDTIEATDTDTAADAPTADEPERSPDFEADDGASDVVEEADGDDASEVATDDEAAAENDDEPDVEPGVEADGDAVSEAVTDDADSEVGQVVAGELPPEWRL